MAYILTTAFALLSIYFWYISYKLKEKHNQELSLHRNIIELKDNFITKNTEANTMIYKELMARHEAQQNELETKLRAEFAETEAKIRKDAVERAKYVSKGFDGETFSPLLQKSWLSTDFRHIGDPIDYLVISGASLVRAGLEEDIESITLLEVKTGGADMNKVQRRIRDAVVRGKVQFGLYNPDTQVTRIWSPTNPAGKL